MDNENNINDSQLAQTLIDYYKRQGQSKSTTTFEIDSNVENKKDNNGDQEISIQTTINDFNNNEISISRIIHVDTTNNKEKLSEQLNKEVDELNQVIEDTLSPVISEQNDEEIDNFLRLNNLINMSSKTSSKTKDADNSNSTNELRMEIEETNESNVDEEIEMSQINRPKSIKKRFQHYSFDSNSLSIPNSLENSQLKTHYKEIKVIKTYNVITTFVFKETFDPNNLNKLDVVTEYSHTNKEFIGEKTQVRLIQSDQVKLLKDNKPLVKAIETESEESDIDEAIQMKPKPVVKETKVENKKKMLKKVSKPTKPVKIVFKNFAPPKIKKIEECIDSPDVIIDNISSNVRFTRSMAGKLSTPQKIDARPKRVANKQKRDTRKRKSIESSISLESDESFSEKEMIDMSKDNSKTIKSNYALRNLQIKLKPLTINDLKKNLTSNKDSSICVDKSQDTTKKTTPKQKTMTIREILTPKFQPNEKAFALCTDGNYYPCIVKSFCQNGIYKCAFLYESENNLSDLYEIKENKLIALDQLRENDLLMVFQTENLRYEEALLCNLSQLTVRFSKTGVRKAVKFCNMALFKDNNIEEISFRSKSK